MITKCGGSDKDLLCLLNSLIPSLDYSMREAVSAYKNKVFYAIISLLFYSLEFIYV